MISFVAHPKVKISNICAQEIYQVREYKHKMSMR